MKPILAQESQNLCIRHNRTHEFCTACGGCAVSDSTKSICSRLPLGLFSGTVTMKKCPPLVRSLATCSTQGHVLAKQRVQKSMQVYAGVQSTTGSKRGVRNHTVTAQKFDNYCPLDRDRLNGTCTQQRFSIRPQMQLLLLQFLLPLLSCCCGNGAKVRGELLLLKPLPKKQYPNVEAHTLLLNKKGKESISQSSPPWEFLTAIGDLTLLTTVYATGNKGMNSLSDNTSHATRL